MDGSATVYLNTLTLPQICVLCNCRHICSPHNVDLQAYCEDLEAEGLARVARVSLGPVPLLASQCIVLIHHYLDRLTHTCKLFKHPDEAQGSRTPTSLRGQQCLPADAYTGWGAPAV